MIETPRAAPKQIGDHDLRLVDQRDLSEIDLAVMSERRRENLLAFFAELPQFVGVDLCDHDEAIERELRVRHAEVGGDEPFDTWRSSSAAMLHDGMTNPDEWQFNLAVEMAGQPIGGLHFGNVRREIEADGLVEVNGFFWSGCAPLVGRTLAQTWAFWMNDLLETGFELVDGRRVRVCGFRFAGAPRFTWSTRTNRELGVAVDLVAGDQIRHPQDPDRILAIRCRT